MSDSMKKNKEHFLGINSRSLALTVVFIVLENEYFLRWKIEQRQPDTIYERY